MKHIIAFMGLLLAVALPLCAQTYTAKDSIRLKELLESEGEIILNRELLKEIEQAPSWGSPKASTEKAWMNYDVSMPIVPQLPQKKIVLTLRPYTTNTRYDWDPIYQKKIKVDKDTWRGEFYELTHRVIYTNWAKNPLDAGPRETVEQIEATGMRYRVTERANNMAVGGWQKLNAAPSGIDLMKPFTKEFWSFKANKRRQRTLEVLKTYGDSTTVLLKEPVYLK